MDLFTFYWSNVVWLKQKKYSSLNELGHPLWNLVMKSVFWRSDTILDLVKCIWRISCPVVNWIKNCLTWSSFLPPLKRDSSRTKRSDRLFTFCISLFVELNSLGFGSVRMWNVQMLNFYYVWSFLYEASGSLLLKRIDFVLWFSAAQPFVVVLRFVLFFLTTKRTFEVPYYSLKKVPQL